MPKQKKLAKEVKAVAKALHAEMRQEKSASKSRRKSNKSGNSNNAGGAGQLVSAASAYARSMRFRTSKPQRHNVAACEQIATIDSTSTLTVLRYRINPGDDKTFPWLSVSARQWEFYRIKRMRFIFVTRCATDQGGTVILSPDYDNKDAANETEMDLLNTKDAINGTIWADLECKLDPKMMFSQGPRKKVSDSLMFDRDLYDAGIMHIATKSTNSVSPCGALFVDYDIDFEVPAEPVDEELGNDFLNLFAVKTASQALTSGVTAAVTWDALYGVQQGLSYAAGVFTATAKMRLSAHARMTASGTTVASAFTAVLSIAVTGGSVIGNGGNETNPADSGAHLHIVDVEYLLSLDVGDTFQLNATIVADTSPEVYKAQLVLVPY